MNNSHPFKNLLIHNDMGNCIFDTHDVDVETYNHAIKYCRITLTFLIGLRKEEFSVVVFYSEGHGSENQKRDCNVEHKPSDSHNMQTNCTKSLLTIRILWCKDLFLNGS